MRIFALCLALCGGLSLFFRDTPTLAEQGRSVVTYFANGQKKSEVGYLDGKRHGAYLTWYSDGQRALEGNYQNGARDGAWTAWTRDGQRDAGRSCEYRAGERLD